MRKAKALYGKDLKNALHLEQVHLKSEDLPEYRKFFVDHGILEQLSTNNNQLIVGRRGTGKTHLLGTFYENIKFEEKYCDDIAIFISIMDVRPQTPPVFYNMDSAEFSARRVAKELFSSFLRTFFNRLLDEVHPRLEELLKDSRHHFAKEKWERGNFLLTELLSEIEGGSAYDVERKRIATMVSEVNEKTDKGGQIGLKLSSTSISPGLKLGMGAEKSTTEELVETIETKSVYATDLSKVRDLIIDLINVMNIKTLYLLIDEWMELEKRTPSKIQPHFAQLLKVTFFNTGLIGVKIASVWHQTSLYSRDNLEISEGIETGHDINMDINLDTTFLVDEREVYSFCKEILFRRIAHVCPKIEEFRVNGEIDDEFITELFDNHLNFKIFIAASHGIPRDLMNLFQRCTLKINRDFERHCIDVPLISDVSRIIYRTDKRKRIDPSTKAQELLSDINKYMRDRDRRWFFVPNDMSQSDVLRKLVDEELIHQIPSSAIHRDVSDDYKAYCIDFGNYADQLEARRQPLDKLLDEFIIPTFPVDVSEHITEFEIDLSSYDEKREKCGGCGLGFSISHPVFQKHNICPNCGGDL